MAMPNGRDVGRAEKFEEEKRRIIDSCFGKKDDDGSIPETYITHIRVTEYSSSPSTPPPPQGRTPQSEKPRVVIVAVRKSGRVRIHKSKENPNGTFSIGKTWNLDELSAIESFTSLEANPNYRDWAGDVGLVITLGKPYYWQAQTDKEKKFFIASLIKIYGKYTGGKTPELSGFDQRELDQVLGGAQAPRRSDRPPVARPPPPEFATRGNSSISSAYSGGAQSSPKYPPQGIASRSPMAPNGSSSPARSIESSRVSQDQPPLRRLASSNRSQDSVANSFATRSEDGSVLRPRSRNGVNGGTYPTPEPPSTEERPPERKRPPMDPLRPLPVDNNLVPAPLMSPGMRREPTVPPRNMDRMSPRKNSINRRPEISTAASDPTIATASDISTTDGPGVRPGPSGGTPVSNLSTTLSAPPAPPTEPTSATESPVDPGDSRPGLGPMIKSKKSKGEIAGAFWKAAAAATAFKPRPGGAGERLRQAKIINTEGPDGITGVVPAPPRPVSAPKAPEPAASPERVKVANSTSGIPEVKVTVPNQSRASSLQPSLKEVKNTDEADMKDDKEERRRSIVHGNDVKYLTTLGVDPAILDSRSTEFAKWLDYFGWVPGEQMRTRTYEDMKVDVERELNKAQGGGWLARFREEDERVEGIKKGIDLAINECEELDNLLTLYSVELSTLSEDIAYIEAQGQGLQVQAANQKLLRTELESLLETCAISASDLDALKAAPLETPSGIEEIETALVTLYKAMTKIDPGTGSGEARKSEDEIAGQAIGFNSDYGSMRIVQEKKEMYQSESSLFLRRLVEFMARQFDEAYRATKRAMDGALSKKVDPRNHDSGRDLLWKYSPFVLYAREMDLGNWNRIIQIYQDMSTPVYKIEFRDALEAWKRNARKPTGEEHEILFTYQQEKKEEGIATTARKLTVKRSQTLARSLRSPLEGSRTNLEKPADSRALAYEVFGGVLDDILPLVEMEQNFVIDFFHATTLDQADFPDAVAAARPRDRRGGDLRRHRMMEPDRDLARRVTRAMEAIFSFLEKDLQNLVDWVVSNGPLQGIGVLATLESKMAEMGQSNQDFLNNMLQRLHANLEGRFKKFVDEQVRAIEETKVKIKKRKGVISFMRIFPQFSTAVENMLAGADPSLNVRRTVDNEYDRILKTMFDSLKVIARENPAVGVGGAANTNSADPEDKEALNYHILLIENMNHYLEEIDNSHSLEILDDWKEAAQQEFAEHMSLYLTTIMRRPLGKLLEHLENIEAQLAGGKGPSAVAAQPSNSKAIFNKVLGAYDAREVRKGIEALRKRVEKHFGDVDADHPTASGGAGHPLVARVLRECERFYGDVELRIGRITTDVYGGDVLFEWPRAEVKSAFSTVGR